jgi:hypothetical protein
VTGAPALDDDHLLFEPNVWFLPSTICRDRYDLSVLWLGVPLGHLGPWAARLRRQPRTELTGRRYAPEYFTVTPRWRK